jgi:hypothetical protein
MKLQREYHPNTKRSRPVQRVMIETRHPITESTGWPTVHTSVLVCLWSVFNAEAARLRHDGRVESGAKPHGRDNVT